MREVESAIEAVCESPCGHVMRANTARLVGLQSYWKHWPCLFPRHGPGMKHQRPIVLAPWQRDVVDAHPRQLIRGLIHSDGCRSINKVSVRGQTCSYPRYFFSNESGDILAIMGRVLDQVGVEWRFSRRNCISIARRASVAVMDAHVGPKT